MEMKQISAYLGGIALVLSLVSLSAAGPAPRVQDPQLPDGPGKEIVTEVCSTCHDTSVAISKRGTEKEWKETVDLMIERGAALNEEQAKVVVAYLAKHFGPQASH